MFVANYHLNGRRTQRANLSVQEIMSLLDQLNNADSLYIHVWFENVESGKNISIIAGHLSRRLVIGGELSKRTGEIVHGRLIDLNVGFQAGTVEFLGDRGDHDLQWVRTTVDKQVASNAVRFILENGLVPEDTLWEMPYTWPSPEYQEE